nr:helix-turn-helix domain-containing protein [Prevotella sp. UBA4952]
MIKNNFNMDENLKAFTNKVATRVAINTKDVLTSDEAAIYLGISKSFLYKLTMSKEIPHYKPNGKICYFEREELNRWALRGKCSTITEIADKAQRYCQKGGKL